MTQVVSFEDYRPSPRYDGLPWTQVKIEESATSTGPWTLLETIAISPVDADPANPAYRNFTTQLGTGVGYWYRLTFLDATGDLGLPTFPVQNAADTRPVYASTTELALLVRVVERDRRASLLRVLQSASDEIDSEIGTVDIRGITLPYSSPPALATEVCLERAVEHWQQMQSPFGIVGMGDMGGQATYTARDTWDRHAHKLMPLKGSWGIA